MNTQQSKLANDEYIQRLLAQVSAAEGELSLKLTHDALSDHPNDPRLHFLHGSILASEKQYEGALAAFEQSFTLAPDYSIARFQYGLLSLTLGQPGPAIEAWQPLHALSVSDPLRVFAEGLQHMIHDQFEPAIRQLEAGIAINTTHPELNKDIRLILDRIHSSQRAPSTNEAGLDAYKNAILLGDPSVKH